MSVPDAVPRPLSAKNDERKVVLAGWTEYIIFIPAEWRVNAAAHDVSIFPSPFLFLFFLLFLARNIRD